MEKIPRCFVRCFGAWALCAAATVHGASAFDSSINRLFITSVSVNGVSYQNVSATVDSYTLLGVDGGIAGSDTFNPTNNLLTLGSVVFLGTTYNNVRVQLNSFTLLAATPVTDSPSTPAPSTPVNPTPSTPINPAPVQNTGTLTATNTCGLANFQSDLMALINQARATSQVCGGTSYPAVATVAWNSNLLNAAAGHSADMASQNYFSHTSLDGRSFDQRISAAGYAWSNVGENIAAGQSSVSSVMADWMASAGHCANIMNSRFTEVGVACVINNASTYRSYWTMNLGRP